MQCVGGGSVLRQFVQRSPALCWRRLWDVDSHFASGIVPNCRMGQNGAVGLMLDVSSFELDVSNKSIEKYPLYVDRNPFFGVKSARNIEILQIPEHRLAFDLPRQTCASVAEQPICLNALGWLAAG